MNFFMIKANVASSYVGFHFIRIKPAVAGEELGFSYWVFQVTIFWHNNIRYGRSQ
jgi:hypothetical protein